MAEEEVSSTFKECEIFDLLLNGSFKNSVNNNQSRKRAQRELCYNDGTCFLEALLGSQNTNNRNASRPINHKINLCERKHSLLVGPQQSGKTSIAMDMAHSILCRSMSHTREQTMVNEAEASYLRREVENDEIVCDNHESQYLTSTKIVVLIRHASTAKARSQGDTVDATNTEAMAKDKVHDIAWFPMKLNPSVQENCDTSGMASHNNEGADKEKRKECVKNDLNDEWNKEALRHIVIHYPANYRELIQLLASLQGILPWGIRNNRTNQEEELNHDHTTRISSSTQSFILKSIVVDDLHLFLASPNSQTGMTSGTASMNANAIQGPDINNTISSSTAFDDSHLFMKFHQVVSLTLDAANCIERMQGHNFNKLSTERLSTKNCDDSTDVTIEHVMWIMNEDDMTFMKNLHHQSMILSTGITSILSISLQNYYNPPNSSSRDIGRRGPPFDGDNSAKFDVFVNDSVAAGKPRNATSARRGCYDVQRLQHCSTVSSLHFAEWTVF